jgi:polysaccharide pyruvyl transferase WcaK-like protein
MSDETGTDVYVVEADGRRQPRQSGGAGAMRATVSKPTRIGLLEHCGTGNLGDDATVATVLQQIKRRWPRASVIGLSLDPEDSERRHGIPCFAIRQSVFPFEREWSSAARPASSSSYAGRLKAALKKTGPLFKAARTIRNAIIVRPVQLTREAFFLGHSLFLARELDMIIICGGGQLLDWGGPWAFPYTLFKWIVLAKSARAKCIFLNNGAGPLDAPLSRWFIRRALSMADYVSLRDRASVELIRQVGVRGTLKVVADSAWGLHLPKMGARRRSESERELVIGVAPMAYGDSSRHWVDDNRRYSQLIDSLAKFSGELLKRGHRINLFSSDIWFDSKAISDLDTAIHEQYPTVAAGRVTRDPVASIDDMLAALSRVDCYVTCRFHGVVFASLLNVPSLALAPHPKVTALMGDMGLTKYCVGISEFDAGDLIARFDNLIADIDDVKARIRRHVECFQSLLVSQFDGLFRTNAEIHGDERVLSIRSAR